VCVWSLTSLDQILGKHGLLPGVAVQEKGGAVVVAVVEKGSPAAEELKVGNVIEGVVEGGKMRKLATPYAFYEAVDRYDPGSRVTLRVRGKKGDVTLAVGQGADVRNPLLSLFVARKPDRGPRGWVGWSPLGPFDSSGPGADRLIGWHFNTGKREEPVTFAP